MLMPLHLVTTEMSLVVFSLLNRKSVTDMMMENGEMESPKCTVVQKTHIISQLKRFGMVQLCTAHVGSLYAWTTLILIREVGIFLEWDSYSFPTLFLHYI